MSAPPFESLIRVLPVGAAVLDDSGAVIAINALLAGALQLDADEAIGRPVPAEATEGLQRIGFEFDGRSYALVTLEPDARVRTAREEASRIKHAVNNVLMGLLGHAEILRDLEELPAGARERAGRLMDEARRVREAVAELDDLGRH